MTAPILKTKLHIPELRSKVVPRPRLTERLNEGSECRLFLVSAPAGFGKTTIVCDWIAGCDCPAAWLSLDERDNDPAQFLSYVVAALQTISDDLGKSTLEALHSMQTLGIETVLTTLLNEISDLHAHFLFVLDDYHVIEHRTIHDALAFLITHMPPNMRLVINTRTDPDLPLSRLRSRNQLLEVREADLRFTQAEAAAFLNHVMALNLSDKDVESLETRTEGWIAGLQLAAVSMRGRNDIRGFIDSFSGSNYFIMDYLIEEVLRRQPDEIQTFLLRTSILDRLCGSLCDAVMQKPLPCGQKTLEYLERANLFIIPLDSEQTWYRYHHLFSDLLRQRLLGGFRTCPDGESQDVAKIHRCAGKWFEENGFKSEAINHAILAKDFEKAAALIETSWYAMDQNMQSSAWLAWAKRIPDEMVRSRPVLSVGYAWALLDIGDIAGCEPRLRDAEECMEILSGQNHGRCDIVVSDEEQFEYLPATIATARAYQASALGDSNAAVMHAEKALQSIPDNDYGRRFIVNTLLGLARWENGELEAAYATITDGLDSVPDAFVKVAVVLAELKMGRGDLNKALEIYEKALMLAADKAGIDQIPIASFYAGIGKIKHFQGEPDESEKLLEQSIRYGEKIALPNWRYHHYLLDARIKASRGDFGLAIVSLNEAEKHYHRNPIPAPEPLHALKARILIRQGKIFEAQEWVKEHGLSIDDELCYLREFEHITHARVLISEFLHSGNSKSITNAGILLERLSIEAKRGKRLGSSIEILVLQALACNAGGETETALDRLEEALRLAEPEGYRQVFIDEGKPIARLLSLLASSRRESGFASRLLADMENTTEPQESGKALSKSCQGLIEPLSARETEILTLIAQGCSNDDICQKLFLALSTVKGYNRNLFDKLQVKNRTEAVARARELGIL